MVNNLDWTAQLSALDFLRDIGKHFPVNRMLDREAVSARLAAGGISLHRVQLPAPAVLDFLELYRRYGCALQTGGSDQWGNITAGVDLIRRVTEGAHALPRARHAAAHQGRRHEVRQDRGRRRLARPRADLAPTRSTSSGSTPTTPRWSSLLQILHLPHARGDRGPRGAGGRASRRPGRRSGPWPRTSPTLVHGADEPRRPSRPAGRCSARATSPALPPGALEAALREAGLVGAGPGGPRVADLLVATGLAASKGAARRTVAEGGAYLNNVRVEDPAAVPAAGDRLAGGSSCCAGAARRSRAVEYRGLSGWAGRVAAQRCTGADLRRSRSRATPI